MCSVLLLWPDVDWGAAPEPGTWPRGREEREFPATGLSLHRELWGEYISHLKKKIGGGYPQGRQELHEAGIRREGCLWRSCGGEHSTGQAQLPSP